MSEAEIQKAVFETLRKRGKPGIVFWHCPNSPDSRRKSGFVPGASDVMILWNGRFHALELKTEKNMPDEAQLEFIDRINCADGTAFCARGLGKAILTLEDWGVIRREAA